MPKIPYFSSFYLADDFKAILVHGPSQPLRQATIDEDPEYDTVPPHPPLLLCIAVYQGDDPPLPIVDAVMMASAPAQPTLPISNPKNSGAAPIATPTFRLYLSRLFDSVRLSLSNRRPWSELLNHSVFSRPDSLSKSTSRIQKTLAYFRVNYLTLLAAILALSLLSHPSPLLVLLSLLTARCFLYLLRPTDPLLIILDRTFSEPHSSSSLGALVLLTVLIVLLTSVGSLLISALMVGAAHCRRRLPSRRMP